MMTAVQLNVSSSLLLTCSNISFFTFNNGRILSISLFEVSTPNSDGKNRLTPAALDASMRASWAEERPFGPLRLETTASIGVGREVKRVVSASAV